MALNCYSEFSAPVLNLVHRGKVRDSYSIDSQRRLIAVTDRISAFDFVLNSRIPMKGSVLNGLSNFWFSKTGHIIGNHYLEQIDPNLTIVRQAVPVKLEMVVRGYLCGSMLRYYNQGKRVFSGISVPDGLTKHFRFEEPIVTPTTKAENDVEISPDEIVAQGILSKEVYEKLEATALSLYKFGRDYLWQRGVILVDTKYEFGFIDGELILIDEIHTPDSSRFWRRADYEKDPERAEQIDKEFLRQWLLANKKNGEIVKDLPGKIIKEVTERYLDIFSLVTGSPPQGAVEEDVPQRIKKNLIKAGLLQENDTFLIDKDLKA